MLIRTNKHMDIFRLRSEPVKKERPNLHPPLKHHPCQHHQHWDDLRRLHRHAKVRPSWFSWHPRTWLSLCKLSLERLGERVVTLFTLSGTFNTYCTFRVNMSKKALSDHFPHFHTFTLLISEKGSESRKFLDCLLITNNRLAEERSWGAYWLRLRKSPIKPIDGKL